MISSKNQLIYEDVKRMVQNSVLFASPWIIAMLIAFEKEPDLNKAWAVALPVLFGLVIDGLRKYRERTIYK